MLLLPGLLPGAAHFAAPERRRGALPFTGLLHDDRLVHERRMRLTAKHFHRKLSRAHFASIQIDDIDGWHV
jgi:hypothetical protein